MLVLPDGHVRIAGLDRAVRGRCCADPGSTTGAVPRGGRRDSVVLPAGDVALLGLGLDPAEREAPSRDEGEREWEEAPEVLLGWAHGLEVDWWAYGVVVGWMAWGQVSLLYLLCVFLLFSVSGFWSAGIDDARDSIPSLAGVSAGRGGSRRRRCARGS